MNNKSQLLKGSLEGCVLKTIELKKEIYGYDIGRILKANGFSDISEGTLYPLYTRLQKNGLITSNIKQSALGPTRKYFTLTDKGREELENFIEAWQYMSEKIDSILKGEIE